MVGQLTRQGVVDMKPLWWTRSRRSSSPHALPLPTAPAIPAVVWRNTWLLAGTQAVVGVGNQMVPALGAIMVLQLLGTPAWAGLATATLGVCRLLVAYPAGYLADAYGRMGQVAIAKKEAAEAERLKQGSSR